MKVHARFWYALEPVPDYRCLKHKTWQTIVDASSTAAELRTGSEDLVACGMGWGPESRKRTNPKGCGNRTSAIWEGVNWSRQQLLTFWHIFRSSQTAGRCTGPKWSNVVKGQDK